MLVLLKKLLLYILKKIVNFLKIFVVSIFGMKCYYFIFLGFYFMKEELYYDLNDYHLYFVLFIFSVYFRYLLSLIVKFNEIPLFYNVIYFYSVWCEIRQLGLLNFVKKIIATSKQKINNIVKRYWNFRLKISPLNLKVNYRIYTIFDKYFKEKDKVKQQKEEKRREEFRRKKAEAMNVPFELYNIVRPYIKCVDGVSKKKKIYVKRGWKPAEDQFPKKPRLSKINASKDFFSRYIRWLDKKENNTILKILLNITMSFFCLLDLFFLGLLYLFNYKINIVWKPLNIRLAYFKKIKKNVKRKLKIKCMPHSEVF